MADRTLFNYLVDLVIPYGDVPASYEPVYDLGVKYMFRAFMFSSTLDQEVSIKFDNDGASGAWDVWDSLATYSRGAIVQDSAGDAYQSLVNINQGNEPASSPAEWTPFTVELTIPGLAAGWSESRDGFRHNGIILLKHNGTPPTSGFIKFSSWRAE